MGKEQLVNLKGQKINMLTFIEICYSPEMALGKPIKPNKRTYWWCKCDCGKFCVIDSYNARKGVVQSCGCLHDKGHPEALRKYRAKKAAETEVKRATEHLMANWRSLPKPAKPAERKMQIKPASEKDRISYRVNSDIGSGWDDVVANLTRLEDERYAEAYNDAYDQANADEAVAAYVEQFDNY